jgi:hypothetical protein
MRFDMGIADWIGLELFLVGLAAFQLVQRRYALAQKITMK